MMMLFKIVLILISAGLIKSNSPTISYSYNKFAFQLYDKLAKDTGQNVFYSPYSISSALSMCLLGAGGNTEKQLKNVLNFDLLSKTFDLSSANAQLFSYLNQLTDGNLTLSMANKIFPKEGFEIKQQYLDALLQTFQSRVHLIDFSNPGFAASLINSWISSQTNDKIKNLLNADAIDQSTVMVLVNAIYFKGNWLYKFDKSDTIKDKFHLDDGSTKDVDMMHLESGYFRLRRNPLNINAMVCEFPYVGRSIAMTIILPNDNVKISEIEKVLDYDRLKSIFEIQGFRTRVDVYIPKFKFEQSIELNSVLASMGALDAFDANKANFSGITDQTGLYISKVLHKAIIEVSEEGTEAAAATVVVTNNRNSVINIPIEDPPVFRCDKPFLFVIHETQNNTILFVGKYAR